MEFPKEDRAQKGAGYKYGFTPLVLDAASGVGKSQQAMALLKKHGRLNYVLLVDPACQDFYAQMDELCGSDGFASFMESCDNTIEALKSLPESALVTDHLSVPFISKKKDHQIFSPLLKYLLETELYYEKGKKKGQHRLSKRNPFDIGEEVKATNFDNPILFIDEALPPRSENKKAQKCLERIKFLHNLGRVLGMRVCIAGTGASSVCVDMFEKTNSTGIFDSSRMGTTRITTRRTLRWMDFHFLWRPMVFSFGALTVIKKLA